MDTATTRTQIIQLAQRLIQERGYNGFSYRDLADQIGIKTSSVHYHFPQKEDLLLATIEEYCVQWRKAMATIESSATAAEKLRRYVDLHCSAFGGTERVCLGGALSADLSSVSDAARETLQMFYRANESWIANVLEEGKIDGSLRRSTNTQGTARALFAAVQGGMFGARLFHDRERLSDLISALEFSDTPLDHAL